MNLDEFKGTLELVPGADVEGARALIHTKALTHQIANHYIRWPETTVSVMLNGKRNTANVLLHNNGQVVVLYILLTTDIEAEEAGGPAVYAELTFNRILARWVIKRRPLVGDELQPRDVCEPAEVYYRLVNRPTQM